MNRTIRVLHLEDDPRDAELIRQKLKAEGLSFDIVWVNGREAFESALDRETFDLALSDYNLPDYDGNSAVKKVRQKQPELPVIIISGAVGEDEAVECLKAGANDYVLKQRLQRLGSVVTRALHETDERKGRLRAEEALRESENRLRLALEASEVSVWDYDVESGEVHFSRHLGPILGYGETEAPSRIESWEALVHPQDLGSLKAAIASHYRGESPGFDAEYRMRARSGEWRWVQSIGRVVERNPAGRATRMTGTHRDVTQRRQAEENLRLYKLAIESATNAILIADALAPDCPLIYVNQTFEQMTGYPLSEVVGKNCRFLQREDRDQPEIERLRAAIRTGEASSVLLRNYRKDGTLFWNSLQTSPVRNEAGVVTHFVGIQSDVTTLKNYQAELEHRANYDALTGLANKNLLDDRMERAISQARRSGRQIALLYLDLDRFKMVNDSLGHASGDALLKSAAERLTNCVRESDTVARLGGDEFVVVLTELESTSSVPLIAGKIIAALEKPFTVRFQEVFVSTSIGIGLYPTDGEQAETLLKNADLAMYRAKHGGGGQFRFHTEGANEGALERLELEADLRHALDRGEFELHYQPRVELRSGRITSVEALIRWRREGLGLVSPAKFIPLAEETGLIVAIGDWVLRTACAQMRAWSLSGCKDMRVAVNLSARQFREPGLLERVGEILAETKLETRHLEIEITESMAMQDPAHTRTLLERLNKMGIAIAIDDFGTGYSSLAYLKRFPIDYLKIDQSFVRGIPADRDDASIIRAIIALGKSLELVLIAEGVETEAQREFLRGESCDEMQGYLYSRPVPADQLGAMLHERVRNATVDS